MIEIKENVLLSSRTTFRIGGPAKYFVEVSSEAEFIEALEYAQKNHLEYFVLGGGSNVLFSDQGFNGLVIKMKIADFSIEGIVIEAGVGVPLAKVVRGAIENELSGMEWAAGIPGSIGGAVRGNAGAFGESMGNVLESIRVLDVNTMEIKDYLPQDCQFDYRSSIFKKEKKLVVLSVKIKLEKGIKDEISKKSNESIQKRISGQPVGQPSAGSYFMNPLVENRELVERFEKDRGVVARGNKLPAGWLIDQAGIKGKKIGGAMVSEKHPNFLVNAGGATAEDVIILESFVKQQVRDQFGVELVSEVEHVGF
jgi:UDP-N-acetylmuramate dehydrogenase